MITFKDMDNEIKQGITSRLWSFREDMLNHYINGSSNRTFQDAENRLNYLEKKVYELEEELKEFKIKSIHNDLPQSARVVLFGCLIDTVEDWLESKGITPADIPNPERPREDEYGAIIYGSDYDELADKFAIALDIDRDNIAELEGEIE